MAHDLDVSMPLVANLVSMTATSWGVTSAVGGWLSDRIGRRVLLVAGLFALALAMVGAGLSPATSSGSPCGRPSAGGCAGTFTGVVFAEVSARVEDHQRGRASAG